MIFIETYLLMSLILFLYPKMLNPHQLKSDKLRNVGRVYL